MLGNPVVAGARRHVVAVGPDRGPRIVRKQRPEEFVAEVAPERIGAGAHRVTHRVGSPRRFVASAGGPVLGGSVGRRAGCCRRRLKQRDGRARLAGPSWRTHIGGLAALPLARLIRPLRGAREYGHHDEPPIRDLIVADHGVAVVARLARPAESPEHVVGRHRPVERAAGRVESVAFLGEDRHPGVHDLHDVIRSDREAVVRRIAQQR